MKKILISFIFTFMVISLFAERNDTLNYIVTKNDTLSCKEITVGRGVTTCCQQNDVKIKLSDDDIISYSLDGRIYEKKPLIIDQIKSKKTCWMELLKCKCDMKVFKYRHYDYQTNKMTNEYFVFNNKEEFVVQINEKNKAKIADFFGCKCPKLN
jgi:hypothetical protein